MTSNPEWKRDNARQAEIDRERFEKALAANEDPRLAPGFHVEERRAIALGFRAAVGEMNRSIRDADMARRAQALAGGVQQKVLDNQEYAVRTHPHSGAPQMPKPRFKMTLDIDAWAHGEILRANDVWFRIKGSGWVWSGEFRPEDRNVGTLPESVIGDLAQFDPEVNRQKIMAEQRHGSLLAEANRQKIMAERRYGSRLAGGNSAAQGSKEALLPDTPKLQRTPSRNPEEERLRQASMAYAVGPHPWFGWRVLVDTAKGERWEFWRPSKASAERTGHTYLEKQVRRRQRLWEAANPKRATALDRYIVMPTQAEQSAKEQAEWDAQFHGKEEQ